MSGGWGSSLLCWLASVTLTVTVWLGAITIEPGSQILASLGLAFCSVTTIRLTVAAVRTDARERLAAEIRRIERNVS